MYATGTQQVGRFTRQSAAVSAYASRRRSSSFWNMPPAAEVAPFDQVTCLRSSVAAPFGRRTKSSRRQNALKVFSLAFSPCNQYLFACCSSLGVVLWNVGDATPPNGMRVAFCLNSIAAQEATGVWPLYDVSIISAKANADVEESHFLLAAGAGGVAIYKWSEVLRNLNEENSARSIGAAATTSLIDVRPCSILRVHPSPRKVGSVHKTSFDASLGVICGCSDDGFGTYCWSLSGKILGSLNNGSGSTHTFCSVLGDGRVLTCDSHGLCHLFDIKELKVIDTLDCGALLCDSYGKLPSSLRVSISALDVTKNDDWVIVGGLCSSKNPKYGGFVALLHLPSRSLVSSSMLREAVYSLKFQCSDSASTVVSVGNEGVVSYRNSTDLSSVATARKWLTTPCGLALVLSKNDGFDSSVATAVGGRGDVVDVFRNGHRVFELQVPANE